MTASQENQEQAPQASPIRLGDLLTGAGLLKPEDLRQAMVIAKNQALPVGRVLIMSGFIVEPHLQAAVQAQSMLKDGIIDLETALGSLRIISQEDVQLDQALSKMGWSQAPTQTANKLGDLLIDAGIIEASQLEMALQQVSTNHVPIGRVLVINRMITEQLLASALNAQILVRDRRVTREQAISSLRAAKERQLPLEQTLPDAMPGTETVRLGELLVMGKLLDEEKLMQAVELGLINEQPIGQVLVQNNMVTEAVLQSALAIQGMVARGRLQKKLCGQVLQLVNQENLSVEAAVEKVQPTPQAPPPTNLPLYQFLQLAGVIGAREIEEALKVGSRDSRLMGQMLMMIGALDQNLFNIALNCIELMAKGVLKTEQAIIALGICWKSQATLEEAFKQLGWSPAIIAAALPTQSAPTPPGPLPAAPQAAGQPAGQPGSNLPPAMMQVLAQQQAKQAQLQAQGQTTGQISPSLVTSQAQAQSVPVQQVQTGQLPAQTQAQPQAQSGNQQPINTDTTSQQSVAPAATAPAPAPAPAAPAPTTPVHPGSVQQKLQGQQPQSRRGTASTASATAANLPAMTPGQALHVAQGSDKPYDTGEMSPLKDKDKDKDAPSADGAAKAAKKRLADLIP